MTNLTEIVLEATEPTFNLSLILATLWIINNDFAKFTTSALTIGQYAINQRNRLYHNDLINEIIRRAMIKPGIKIFIEGEIQKEILHEDDEEEVEERGDSVSREKCIWFLDSMISYG